MILQLFMFSFFQGYFTSILKFRTATIGELFKILIKIRNEKEKIG